MFYKIDTDTELAKVIHDAVHKAIEAIGGVEELRKCSFFPSAHVAQR